MSIKRRQVLRGSSPPPLYDGEFFQDNDDLVNRIRVGPSGVTQQSGTPVEPGASAEFPFDQAASIPVFAISEGAAVAVNIWEGK